MSSGEILHSVLIIWGWVARCGDLSGAMGGQSGGDGQEKSRRWLGAGWVGGGCSVNHAGDGGKPLAVSVSLFGAGLCFCPLLGDALGGAAFVGV